jgi:myo-inositol-1(or 4)-monophosphatase
VTDLHHYLAIAHQALDIAAPMLRQATPGHETVKDERDYATETDYAVERRLRRFLIEAAPHIGFLGEEEGWTGDRDRYWVLDPIDGTANFTHRLPLCAISLALIDGDHPMVGAVDLPYLAARYGAVRRAGAVCNGHPISASRTSSLGRALVAIGDYATGHDSAAKNAQRLALTAALAANAERLRMLGTAATDLVWVAHGRLDASVTLSNKPWDTAAGALIASEAGARVLDLDGSPHTTGSRATIATAPDLAGPLLALLATALDADQADGWPRQPPHPLD